MNKISILEATDSMSNDKKESQNNNRKERVGKI